MTKMARLRLEYGGFNDVLTRCVVVGPDGEELHLPVTAVREAAEAHTPGTVELHLFRRHVDHVRDSEATA